MNKLLAMLFLLVATPVMAASVTIDHDKDFDFSKVKTFQYVETNETRAKDPVMAERIVKLLKEKLVAAGLSEVQKDPDLRITYHFTSQEHQLLDTQIFGSAGSVAPGDEAYSSGQGEMVEASKTKKSYVVGTLIIDAYQGGKTNMVWRGSGTITEKKKPEKQAEQIETILEDLGKKWEKILAKEGE
jgi:hypothetical protein